MKIGNRGIFRKLRIRSKKSGNLSGSAMGCDNLHALRNAVIVGRQKEIKNNVSCGKSK